MVASTGALNLITLLQDVYKQCDTRKYVIVYERFPLLLFNVVFLHLKFLYKTSRYLATTDSETYIFYFGRLNPKEFEHGCWGH